MRKRVTKLKNGKSMVSYPAMATVDSVDAFPLTGAIVHYTCSCGAKGGQPLYGKPSENRILVGTKFSHWCLSKIHSKEKVA